MIIKIKYLLLSVIVMLVAACQKEILSVSSIEKSGREILVKACAESDGSQTETKSPFFGTAMPKDRNLVISAYFNHQSDGQRGVDADESDNYFENVKFSYNENNRAWTPEDDQIYWPLSGNLDFLSYSAEQGDLHADWGDDDGNVSKKVVLSGFNKNMSVSDDILYGVAKKQSSTTRAVPIEFRHAKSLIIFTAKANYDDAITIIDITMEGIASADNGSILTIDSSDGDNVTASWSRNTLQVAENIPVPGINSGDKSYPVPIKAMDVNKRIGYCGIGGEGFMVIGNHQMTSFTVTFTQRAPSGKTLTKKFSYAFSIGIESDQAYWKAGKRYIYELDFNLHEITVSSDVSDWDGNLYNVDPL